MRLGSLAWAVLLAAGVGSAGGEAGHVLLFEELFEDTNWEARGWYDEPGMEITTDEHIPDSGHCCLWRWEQAGDLKPRGGGARLRLPPVDDVLLSFHIRHSADWTWTGVSWHPHELHFVTTADSPYVGPAYTHLTLYVEAVNGVPRVAIQDGANIDETRIDQDLVKVTEARAVAGCNGDADGYGPGNCYQAGDVHANGKVWEPDTVYFGDTPGRYYKGDWHRVQVRLRLNRVVDGVGRRDGVLQYWFDDELVMDRRGVVFRTGQHPDMRIDQFLMTPYYGPGVPHPQSIWIDDLRIYAVTASPDSATSVEGPDTTWGRIKRRAE